MAMRAVMDTSKWRRPHMLCDSSAGPRCPACPASEVTSSSSSSSSSSSVSFTPHKSSPPSSSSSAASAAALTSDCLSTIACARYMRPPHSAHTKPPRATNSRTASCMAAFALSFCACSSG
eukprot:3628606-Rhodomonas_salina.2